MLRRVRGQSGSETMLVISVVVLAVVASSATLIPLFADGVQNLGEDARTILGTGSVGGVGDRGNGSGNGATPGTSPSAGPEDRATANNRMHPDSQRPGDATGTQSPGSRYIPDVPTNERTSAADRERRAPRVDNIGPIGDQIT